jgi:acyl-CoA reductase-like NAD-dependent aldehyde dehydrogenase
VPPQGGKTFDVINPATEQLLGRAPLGETADIDAAVKCARDSFDSGVWSSLTGAQRAVVAAPDCHRCLRFAFHESRRCCGGFLSW